jgi:hypothetical protein
MHFDPRAILGADRGPPRDPSSSEGPPLLASAPSFDSSSSGFGYRSGSGSGVAPLQVPRDPFASGTGTDPAVRARGRGLGPPPSDPNADQDLYETVDDDSPPDWGPQDMMKTDDAIAYGGGRQAKHDSLGLGQVSFECPYCEQAVAAHTRHCPRCKKDL